MVPQTRVAALKWLWAVISKGFAALSPTTPKWEHPGPSQSLPQFSPILRTLSVLHQGADGEEPVSWLRRCRASLALVQAGIYPHPGEQVTSWALGARRVLPEGLEESWAHGSRSQGTSSPILMHVWGGGAKATAESVRSPPVCRSRAGVRAWSSRSRSPQQRLPGPARISPT